RLLRAHQDRRQTGPAQGIFPAGHHDQHRGFGSGDRRTAAAGRAGQLGQGRRAHGRPSDRPRPRRRSHRPDSGPGRFGLRQPRGGGRVCPTGRALLVGDDPQRRDRAADPDTGEWISDAEVAEIPYTAFASTPDAITARLVVRRVKDARYRDALFPVWQFTRSSPTPTPPSSRPTSPTATTPSSKPYSPSSSTDPWPICPRDASAPTPPGSCARRSPTTCG